MGFLYDPENILSAADRALLERCTSADRIDITRLIGEGVSGSRVLLADFHFAPESLRKHYNGPNFIKIDRSPHVQAEAERYARARQGIEIFAPALVLAEAATYEDRTAAIYSPAGESVLQAASLARLIKSGKFAHAQIGAALRQLCGQVLKGWNSTPAHRTMPLYDGLLTNLNCGSESGRRLQEVMTLKASIPGGESSRLWLKQAGRALPNPIPFLGEKERWRDLKLAYPVGRAHGDLHSGNLLCRMDQPEQVPFLIDFARYQDQAPLFFDLAYLEIDLLLTYMQTHHANWADWIDLEEVLGRTITPDQMPKRPLPFALLSAITPLREYVQSVIREAPAGLRDQFQAAWCGALAAVGLLFARRESYQGKPEQRITFLHAAYALDQLLIGVGITQDEAPVPCDLELEARPSMPTRVAATSTPSPDVDPLEQMLRDRGKFEQIVELLTPHLDSLASRQALIDPLFIGRSERPILNLEGAPETVASLVVQKLITFGQLEPGEQALAALLRALRGRVGMERQRRIDALIAVVNGASRLPELSAHSSVWRVIPGGIIQMGESRFAHAPVREVQTPPFYLARTPVTQQEYSRFVRLTDYPLPQAWDEAYQWDQEKRLPPKGKENHPVVYVSAADAEAYCRWLHEEIRPELETKLPGWRIALPSESEWERAARGEDGRAYPWGALGAPARDRCNFGGHYGGTTAVDQFKHLPSPYGCFDLCGNVWEWTRSAADEGHRVIKGGCWEEGLSLDTLHAAWREIESEDRRLASIGFRVAVIKG